VTAVRLSAGLLERVAAGAAGIAAPDRPASEVREHRARGARRVLEYRFGGDLRLFAKRYPRVEDAVAAHGILLALDERGFGRGSACRVPEPLACFADWGVVVTRAAPGRCVTSAMRRAEWQAGLRAGAAWLARLHSVTAGVPAPCEDPAQEVFRLARRVPRAAARHPELAELLVVLLDELAARAAAVRSESGTLTHGRYHEEHVFVANGTVTVIDLDRASIADPAKDLGEFLHRLYANARRARLDELAAEQGARAFLDGYASHAPAVSGAALVYRWSASCLATLLRGLELDRPKWESRFAYHRGAFDAVPGRVASLGLEATS
jgi:Phosphotransferase enzyme family